MALSFTDATFKADIDDLSLAHILSPQIIEVMWSEQVMQPLCAYESIAGQNTATKAWNRWPALTAAAVAENASIGNTPMTTSQISAGVGEVGVGVSLTDVAEEDTGGFVVSKIVNSIGLAHADKKDADLAVLLGGGSTFIGTTGTPVELTQEVLLEAQLKLEMQDAGDRKLALVTNPYAVHQFRMDIQNNGGGLIQNTPNLDARFGAGRKGYQFDYMNVAIYSTTNVLREGAGPFYYQSGLFVVGETLLLLDKRPMKIEPERDASARLTKIVGHARYGTVELRDEFLVTLNLLGPES